MEPSESTPTVKVGQVWEAYEWRRVWTPRVFGPGGRYEECAMLRTLQVLELVDHGQYAGRKEPGARCHVVETGRKVVVAIRRMKPGKTRGYRLVAEKEGESTP